MVEVNKFEQRIEEGKQEEKNKVNQSVEKYRKKLEDNLIKTEDLFLVHPYSVIIDRIDTQEINTTIILHSANEKQRIRLSPIGRVLKIAEIFSDEKTEQLKNIVQVGDYVFFNPESAFHLEIKDHWSLWTIHIDNIIYIEKNYDPVKILENTLTSSTGF